MPFLSKLAILKQTSKAEKMCLFIISSLFLVAIFADFIAPYDPNQINLAISLESPSLRNVLGTDQLGRDVLSRIIYGTRVSILLALTSVFAGSLIGIAVGLISGYHGGRVDNALQRMNDVLLAFPSILIALVLITVLGPSMTSLILAVLVRSVSRMIRIVRGSVVLVKGSEYVEGARVVGENLPSILLRYILPNVLAPITVEITLEMGTAIRTISSLSFLGLGVQPPTAELGGLITGGVGYLRSTPTLVIFPGIVLLMIVLVFNMFGDSLRDRLDPRFRQRVRAR